MAEQFYALRGVSPPIEPLEMVITPPLRPGFFEPVKRIMEAHGGRLEASAERMVVYFPAGTCRVERWPRVLSTRYLIMFPDGYKIYQVTTRQEVSVLCFPCADLPVELHGQDCREE